MDASSFRTNGDFMSSDWGNRGEGHETHMSKQITADMFRWSDVEQMEKRVCGVLLGERKTFNTKLAKRNPPVVSMLHNESVPKRKVNYEKTSPP